MVDSMGIVTAKKRIVVAQSKTFTLNIRVTDGVCTANANAVIRIEHYNVSTTAAPATNCPGCPSCPSCPSASGYMFGSSHYWIRIAENTTYSNALLTVRLAGSYAANFSILEAAALQHFQINRTTGRDAFRYFVVP